MKKYITDFVVGEKLHTVFLLKKKEILKTKDNKPYLRLVFADKSGSIEGRAWENARELDSLIETERPVIVDATVDEWRSNIQLKVAAIRPAAANEYEQHDLLRAVENVDAIILNVKNLLSEHLSNQYMRLLGESFFADDGFIENLKKAPGAKSWHNAYQGGLIEHTYEVMIIAGKMCELYPEADKDVTLMGSFIHDLGKILELDETSFEYTLEGNLIGHVALGFEFLSRNIQAIDNFPDNYAVHLKHIILSHHGEYEQQAPVLPKTLEATIVYHSDDLVSQANAVREIMATQNIGDRQWSNFISIKNRKYLLKSLTADSDTSNS